MNFPNMEVGSNKIVSIALLLVCIFKISDVHAAERINIGKKNQVVEAENKVWIATPNGLIQYSSEDDSYKRFIVPVRSGGQEVHEIEYNDEWLWCIMDSSVAAMHIRLSEWLIFDNTNGLPSNEVNGIDFTDDYIYVSTDNGAARYDLLMEEWETLENEEINGRSIKEAIVIDDKVWFVSERSVSEYSPDYEQWRHFDIGTDTSLKVSQAYYYNENIWLLNNKGMAQFNPELQSFQFHDQPFLKTESLIEIFTEDDNNWAISDQGLFSFGYESEMWSEFEANAYLSDKVLVNAFIDDSEIWIFTDKDVHVFDRDEKSWEVMDYASGLTNTAFQAAYVNGGMTFLIAENSIEHRLSEEDNWYQYEIKQLGSGGGFGAQKIFSNLFDNESGGFLPIGDRKLSLEGSSITYINKQEFEYVDNELTVEETSGFRWDAKAQFSLSENRNISAFYNDIDYSETMYGLRYRGRNSDLLREVNLGDFRYEPGEVPFGETTSMFGANLWLQAGDKTEKYKRSLVSLKAYTGQKRAQKHYEHFTGVSNDFDVELEDVDYSQNNFYEIPYLDSDKLAENIKIYADDLSSSSNTPNTNSTTIAGISGDFELLEATSDYYYYDKANVIRFTGYSSTTATIVMSYSIDGVDYQEVLQQDSTISTCLSNFYSLKAAFIIPNSFRLNMSDLNGSSIDIADFGLDDNSDGYVDKEWIDYENGILIFPEDYPFPDDVYLDDDPISSYTITAEYETEYDLLSLEYEDLVRESEEVKIDGLLAEGGTDYVLDYTNGTMSFVKDGLVTPETRIEIKYEYYISEDYTQMHAASLNFSPSDNVSVQADWLNFEDEGDDTPTNLIKLHSELRQKVGNVDVKITPAAVYQTQENEESKISAYEVEGVVSSPKIRLQSKYQNFDEDYKNIFTEESVVGQVKENLEISTDIEVHKFISLSGSMTDIKAFQTDNSEQDLYDKNRIASALFHHQLLPGYEISYSNTKTNNDTSSVDKSYIQHKLEYQLPQQLIDKMPIKGLKVEGFLKNGEQSGQEIAGSEEQKFMQSNFRVNLSLAEQFQTSLFYRKNDFIDNSGKVTQDNHVLISERVLFNLSHEKWKLLQTNFRIENSMESYDYPSDEEYDLDLSQYTQMNFRFSPGELWSVLSPLYFEYNFNHSIYSSGNSNESRGAYIWSLLPEEKDEFGDYTYTKSNYIKNEFRPNSNIYFYTLYEWQDVTINKYLSQLSTNNWLLSEKLDAKLGYKTRLKLQYKRYFTDYGYDETSAYHEPSFWVERRWTSSFQNVFYGVYRHTDDFDGAIKDYTNAYDGRIDLILRKKDFLKMRRIELQQSFSGGRTLTNGYNSEDYYNLGSSSVINLYPVHSLILRLSFELEKTAYLDDSESDNLAGSLEFRASFKF